MNVSLELPVSFKDLCALRLLLNFLLCDEFVSLNGLPPLSIELLIGV